MVQQWDHVRQLSIGCCCCCWFWSQWKNKRVLFLSEDKSFFVFWRHSPRITRRVMRCQPFHRELAITAYSVWSIFLFHSAKLNWEMSTSVGWKCGGTWNWHLWSSVSQSRHRILHSSQISRSLNSEHRHSHAAQLHRGWYNLKQLN